MKKIPVLFIGSLALAVPALWGTPQSTGAAAPDTQQYKALIDKYCVACHSEKLKTAGLVLDNRDFTKITADARVWEKVIRKLRAGEMPPIGIPRPDNASIDGFASYLENTIDKVAAANPNPGRTLVHRLNRAEYANAIKDVLTVDADVSQLLPPDDSSDGFDNMAQTLTLSPTLLERYLSASAKISSIAVGDPSAGVVATTYRPKPDLSQNSHIEGTPIGTVGGVVAHHNFALDGEYVFQPKLSRSILFVTHGLEDQHALEITLDGVRMKMVHFGGPEEDTRSHLDATATAEQIDARMAFRARVAAGPHTVSVSFVRQDEAETAEVWQQFQRTAIDSNETKGYPHLDSLRIMGPYNPTGPGDTPSRRRIFICRPGPGQDETGCARKILTALATRAWRRPANDSDLEELLSFYQRGKNKGTFDQGIEMAIRRIISGPEFVFRVEQDPPNVAPDTPYRISDLELASRLSFFLWSTIPDQQLYDLAVQGKLKDKTVLQQQVRRMLADPRAQAIVDNFAAEWLQLRNLRGVVPDPDVFPDFDDNLRQALAQETEMLFASIMKEDRSVADLLTANYTFLNERLARHYGVPGIYGDRYRKVEITDDARKGLLGQGSILTLTSVAVRTSPVARGKWVLINLLGTPPPPPPPNVPALKDDKAAKALTMRDRMTAHRANPFCATCHKVMDPIGFSLENFDAVGRWRVKDGEAKIDAADTLFDGSKVDGAAGLRNFLLSRREVFIQTFTEKLMSYSLGRSLDYYDMPSVRRILNGGKADNDRFSTIVMGIVSSPAFQMRVKPTPVVENASAAEPAKTTPVAASIR
jgi:mono/diheme cytochrome c family protein